MIVAYRKLTGATLDEIMSTDVAIITKYLEYNSLEEQIKNEARKRENNAKP